MCGFGGLLTSSLPESYRPRDVAQEMAARITHRGPDDGGVWEGWDGRLAFGFRRLAIVDLTEAGHQPMGSASGRFQMVFNGEIYNFRELRRELKGKGFHFRGDSDSEVILAAVEAWGIQSALKRLVGMFAIAIWDDRDEVLHLTRDRLGIKPLFVHVPSGMVAFASELKSLAAIPGFRQEVDPDSLAQYFRYLYVPAPHTIYRDVKKLTPGTLLSIDGRTLTARAETYWDARSAAAYGKSHPLQGNQDTLIDSLERLLGEVVEQHLHADVPVGAFLSAGVDSSTVVATMQELASTPVDTFSIAFDAEEHNEADVAAQIAGHLGTRHTELMLTGKEALDVIPKLPDIFDEPHADTSQIPQFILCEKARQHVTVALSGDGGDEVLGGYNRYIFGQEMLGRAARIPRPIRQLAGRGIASRSPETWDRLFRHANTLLPRNVGPRLPGEKTRKIGRLLMENDSASMYRALVSAWPDPTELVKGTTRRLEVLDELKAGSTGTSILDLMMLNDQLTYLPDDQLAKVDRVSMAVSLEVRVPLVDHRLVEFAWRLPANVKIREKQGKWLLRQVLYRKVPRALVERPKMGLSVPLAQWLRGPLRDWAEDLLHPNELASDGMLNAEPILTAWRRMTEGRGESALGLWAVLNYLAWRRRWRASLIG